VIDRILRYLKKSLRKGIWMKKNNSNDICGYSDADWAVSFDRKSLRKGIWMKNNNSNDICGYSDADWAVSFDRKSTTGYCTFVGGNIVTWKSKKL
jgi:hypothetical protein